MSDLTEEQGNRVRDILKKNPEASISEITVYAYDDPTMDSRSKEGRAVKKFLLDNKIEYKSRSVFTRDRIELTKEQQEFIENNYKKSTLLRYGKNLI